MELNLNFASNKSLPKGNIWLKGLFGVEKENIRVDRQGVISQTPHPVVFEDKLKHPYITTDFSESQVEMITPPLPDIKQALGFLETIHDLVSLELKDELLWPQSMPPVLPDEEHIPIARYSNLGKKDEEYRKVLASKYGRKKQALSGIHFNVSLNETLLKILYQNSGQNIPVDKFQDEIYLKITRQVLRNRWLYVLIFGFSPMVDETFDLKCKNFPIRICTKTRGVSLRNSCFGYGNLEELYPDYSTTSNYLQSIEKMVEEKKLFAAKELYASVRPKFLNKSTSISYTELRFIDINPLSKVGMTPEMLYFLHWMVIYGLLSGEEDDFSPNYQAIANTNYRNVSLHGLKDNIELVTASGTTLDAWDEAKRIITDMQNLYSALEIDNADYLNGLEYVLEMINHPERRVAQQLLNSSDEKGFIPFHLEKAQGYLEQTRQNRYNFKGLEDLELSHPIVAPRSGAARRGI